MKIPTIKDPLIEFAMRVISHKFYQSSQLHSVSCIAANVGYKIVKKDHTCDLVELQLWQIMENLGAIRRSKSAQCNFGSILICIFFYVQNEFSSIVTIGWKTNSSVAIKINDYIEKMGDNFESIMTSYFEDFKKFMKQRLRMPVSIVEQHINDI